MRALAAAVVACALLAVGAAPARAGCADDPFARELITTGDDFRAVGVLKQIEIGARPTDEGFTCGRMLLGLYLRHEEYDLADGWLTRMVGVYPQVRAVAPPALLEAEMAYLFGNQIEVRRRLGATGTPATPEVDALLTFAAAAASPARPPPILCAAPACGQLRRLYDEDPRARARKSPGLALALGIVPGLGQIYAGRVLAGIGSFLLNGALAGLAVTAALRDERAAAIALGGLGGVLYLGNFYAGYEAARRENERRDAETSARVRAIPLDLRLYRLAR